MALRTHAIGMLLISAVLGTACAPAHRTRLDTDPPLYFDRAKAERVRVIQLIERHRVLIERAGGARFVLQLGVGCLQTLPNASELDSIPVLVDSPKEFAGQGAKLVFPVQRQGCAIEHATKIT